MGIERTVTYWNFSRTKKIWELIQPACCDYAKTLIIRDGLMHALPTQKLSRELAAAYEPDENGRRSIADLIIKVRA